MATINLYAGKINQMSNLIGDVKKSVSDYQSELFSLRAKTLKINSSVCNVDDVVRSIQASTQTQDLKLGTLETLQKNTEQFISDVVRTDNEVADVINRKKDEFYEEFTHLKPDSEKGLWEKTKDKFDGFVQWCQDNWESLKKIALAGLIIGGLLLLSVLTAGIATGVFAGLAAVLKAASLGALKLALIGGTMSGIISELNGASFIEGFANGALKGAITGALLVGLGSYVGSFILGGSTMGKLITLTAIWTSKTSLTMNVFDLVALALGQLLPNNWVTKINNHLHSYTLYNNFQFLVSSLSIFTGAATMNFKGAVKEINFGSDTKSTEKVHRQMDQRGWTESSVSDVVNKPYTTRPSTNLATGNSSTVYYNQAGGYVIIDDVTKAIVQISDNINPSTWIPDPNIVNPYKPK